MKKFIRIAFVAAFAAATGYGIYTNQKVDSMSNLMLANVEALADSELSMESCEASWEEECCYCNHTHYTYAHVRDGYTAEYCETRTGCSHYGK